MFPYPSNPSSLLAAAALVFVATASEAQIPLAASETPLETAGFAVAAKNNVRSLYRRLHIGGLSEMMTGWHRVEAVVDDGDVHRVSWRINGRPYKSDDRLSAELYFGRTPQPRRLEALAYDSDGVLRYTASATVNAGGSAQVLDFVSPVAGDRVSGSTEVEVCAYSPPDRPIERLVIARSSEALGGRPVAVDARVAGRGACGRGHVYRATVDLGEEPTVVSAQIYSRERTVLSGRATVPVVPTLERAVPLNMPPSVDEAVDVRLLEWPVQVLRQGEPVRGLGVADFSLLEDRQRCEIERVLTLEHVPLRLALLFDWSGSTALDVGAESRAASEFLEELFEPAKDSVMIGAIAHAPLSYLEWTGNEVEVRQALGRIENGYQMPGGTALYDTLVEVLYQFQSGKARGLPALVILTDGVDTTSSDFSREQALAYARESGVPIYAIAVRVRTDKWHTTKLDEAFLESLAAESGGTLYTIELDGRPRQLLREAATLRAEAVSLRQQPGELANDPRFLDYLIAEKEAEASRRESRAARLGASGGDPLDEIRGAFRRIKSDLSAGYVVVARGRAERRDRWHAVQVQLADGSDHGDWQLRSPRGVHW